MTRKKVWTEAKAWHEVGRRIEKRGKMVAPHVGLCYEMRLVGDQKGFDGTAWGYHGKRMKMHLGNSMDAYPRRDDDDHWEARCLAAYWLALECEDES